MGSQLCRTPGDPVAAEGRDLAGLVDMRRRRQMAMPPITVTLHTSSV